MQNGLNEDKLAAWESTRFRNGIIITIIFLSVLWSIKVVEYYFKADFGFLGIYPRTLKGLSGIFTGPFVHGDFYHLMSNTIPLLMLGVVFLYFYREIAFNIFLTIYILSGFWVWIAARSAFHIGASGLVYGFMFFLLSIGIIKRDRRQLAVGLVVLFLYGGSMFSGLLPSDPGVSFEAHITGAVAGVLAAVFYRNFTPVVFKLKQQIDYQIKEYEDSSPENASITLPDNNNTVIKYTITPETPENAPPK